MNGYLRFLAGALLLSSSVVALSGCGGGKVKASGKVVQNGQPIQMSDKGVMQLAFIEEKDTEGARPHGTTWKPDGTFVITGVEGKGVPPGKYRVSLSIIDPYPGEDKFGGKFQGPKSPLVVDVGKGEVIVDVGK